ncbi:MAG TPA: alpha/beta hydrolase-fold protein [Minicystis sp.]|nr:alpha/beta hydrolase-fold protein [Minicystis sp.]
MGSIAMTGVQLLGPFEAPGFSPRHVRVYAPQGRETAGAKALYLFDGQNVFGDEGSHAGGWHVHEALDALGPQAPVCVAIEHGGVARADELGPWWTPRGGGRGRAFLAWVAEGLVPRLAGELGLSTRPEDVVIGGSSMGGLAALFAHHEHPARFGGVLAMSPSLWFADGALVEHVRAAPRPWTSRIYLDAGGREGGGMAAGCERLAAALRDKGYGERDLRYVFDAVGGHCEAAWRARVPGALAFLFPELSREARRAA